MIRSTRLLGAAIVVMLSCGAVEVSGVREPAPVPRPVTAPPFVPLEPMRTAVSLVGGRPLPDGRLLSARTRRVLDAHAFPAQLRLNGQPVERGELVSVDAHVEVVPGRDRVEPLAQRRSQASPLVTVKGKRRLVRPRVVVVTVGSVSGEELKRTVVMAPPPQRKHRGSVLLTFDDGPDPLWTPRVLALLRQRRVHAVFCVVGREARKHPDLLRQIVREGHQLCDHTQDHDERLAVEAVDVARLQIERGAAAIVEAVGVRPEWFRAPGGGWSPELERLVSEEGMAPLKWTVDPRDWERPPAATIVGRVLVAAKPGGIVLLHDGGGDRAASVAALRSLLVALPRVGLTFSELPHPRVVSPSASAQPTPTPTPASSP